MLNATMQGWSAESNMFAGYGGGYPYAPVGAAVQPPQQQRGTTGDELAADLMRATQAVRLCLQYLHILHPHHDRLRGVFERA
jgi:hypothetical protein